MANAQVITPILVKNNIPTGQCSLAQVVDKQLTFKGESLKAINLIA